MTRAIHFVFGALLLSWLLFGCGGYPGPKGYDEIGTTEDPFVGLCSPSNVNPWAWSYPATAPAAPTPPIPYWCSFYPDPHVYGPTNTPPWLIETCSSPTPAGKVDFSMEVNIGGPRCFRMTAPADGSWGQIDFIWLAGMGWRTNTGTAQTYIRSVEIGPHVTVDFSSNARVDLTGPWACDTTPQTGAKCLRMQGGTTDSLEADHFADTHPALEPGWHPWSFEFRRW